MFHQWASFLSNRTHPWSTGITRKKVSIVLGLFGIEIHYGCASRQSCSPGKHTFPIAVKSSAAFSALFILKELIPLLLPFSVRDMALMKPLEMKGLVSGKERKNTPNDHCRQYIKGLTGKTRAFWLWQRGGFDVSIILSGEAEQSIGEMTGCVPITPRLWGGLMRLVLIVSSTHTQCAVIDCYCMGHRGASEVHRSERTHLQRQIRTIRAHLAGGVFRNVAWIFKPANQRKPDFLWWLSLADRHHQKM